MVEMNVIHNMDCLAYMKTIPDNYFDLVLTDPPYGIGAGKMTMGSGKHKFKKDKSWDEFIPSIDIFDEIKRISKNQIIWGGNYFTEFLHPTPNWIIWDKKNPNLSFAEAEIAWCSMGGNMRIYQEYSASNQDGAKYTLRKSLHKYLDTPLDMRKNKQKLKQYLTHSSEVELLE